MKLPIVLLLALVSCGETEDCPPKAKKVDYQGQFVCGECTPEGWRPCAEVYEMDNVYWCAPRSGGGLIYCHPEHVACRFPAPDAC